MPEINLSDYEDVTSEYTAKPVNMADYEDVTAEYAPLFESKPKPKPRPVSFDMQMYLDSVKEPQKEADKIKSAISNSIFLDIPASAAYSFNDAIIAEQKKRGIDINKLKGTSTIGISPRQEMMRQKDIEV